MWAEEQLRQTCAIIDGDWVCATEALAQYGEMEVKVAEAFWILYKMDNPETEKRRWKHSNPQNVRIKDLLPILATLDTPWSRKLRNDLQRDEEAKAVDKSDDDPDFKPPRKRRGRAKMCETPG